MLRVFSIPELFYLYKAEVLSYIESSTPGVFHAAPSVLVRIIGFTEDDALERYRLAPLH